MDSVLNPSSGGHSTRCGRPDPTNQPSINARSRVGGGRDAVEALGGGYRGSSMVSVDRHRRRRRNAKLDRSPRSSYIGRAATYAHTRDTRSAGRCRGVAKLIFLLGTTGGQRPRFNSSGELTKDLSRIHARGVGGAGGVLLNYIMARTRNLLLRGLRSRGRVARLYPRLLPSTGDV